MEIKQQSPREKSDKCVINQRFSQLTECLDLLSPSPKGEAGEDLSEIVRVWRALAGVISLKAVFFEFVA